MGFKIYLDDERTPEDLDWIVCRNYEEFVNKINELGLKNIETISLDHDLGDTAIGEYFNNVKKNHILDYNNIIEKTGYDCAKWLVDKSMDSGIKLPFITIHSANPVGSANMMCYINNYLKLQNLPQNCIRVKIPFKIYNK